MVKCTVTAFSTVSMSDQIKKRKVIHNEGREIIAKVFHFLQEEYQFMKHNNYDNCDLTPLANITKRTAAATGVSERTVTKIMKEEKEKQSSFSGLKEKEENTKEREENREINK